MMKKLETETESKLISGMIDTATRHKRSILGTNVQYVLNAKIVVRTLAMKRLDGTHDAVTLAKNVEETLKIFGIPLKQLYAVTIVNARNMIKSHVEMDKLSI